MSESGRRVNLIWKYFDKVDEDNKEAECKLCHNMYNYKTTTHNLKNHLKFKHNDVFVNLPASEITDRKYKRNDGQASVWAYFEAVDSERKVASCNECKKQFSYLSTTANLKTHLKRVHKELFAEMEGGECEEVYLDDGDDDSDAHADVWSFFERAGGEARCAICRALVPVGALRGHLRNNHPKLIENVVVDSEDETANNAQDDVYTEVVYLENEDSPKRTEKTTERKKRRKPAENRTRKRRRSSSSDDEPLKLKSKKNEDEIEHFGKYITCLLKKVPQESSMELQMEIVNLIIKKQLVLKRKESILAGNVNISAVQIADASCKVTEAFEKAEASLSNGYSYTIGNVVNVESIVQKNE